MRLIFGIVRFDGQGVDPGALAAMARAMTTAPLCPRLATRIDSTAAFGVLEFDASAPPPEVRLAEDGCWLAADIRLDRPLELADVLGVDRLLGAEELALAAFGQWGEDLPDRMDGDFALAAWHAGDRRLICARDLMGVRPLCYYHKPGEIFAFASLPRGLHGSGVAPRRLDVAHVLQRLIEPGVASPRTQFEDILWLPAAHSLTVTADGARVHRAWRPDPAEVGRWRGSRADAAETLRTLVEQAVACRLPSSGPVACHLSGGLDSSAVAVMAARQLRGQGRRLLAYSLAANPTPGLEIRDDRGNVEAVLAQEPDIICSSVTASPLGEEGLFDEDLPQSGAGIAHDDQICAMAARAGAQILFSGAGGDEGATYNGRRIYRSLFLTGAWGTLWRDLPLRAAREGRSIWRIAMGQILLQLAPSVLTTALRRFRGYPGARPLNLRLQILRPATAQRLTSERAIMPDLRNRAQDRIWMLTQSYLFERADTWSCLAARHGLAFTYPLKDRRVIDFALSLPLHLFVSGGYVRQPFRDAMEGVLPDSVRWQTIKNAPFEDMPVKLVDAKADLLFQVDALRRFDAIAEIFDLNALVSGLEDAPDRRAAEHIMMRGHRPWALRRALAAVRAVSAARYIARMTERMN